LVPAPIVQRRLELVHGKTAERLAQLEALFHEAGCEGEFLTSLAVPHYKQPDVICTLPGTDPEAGVIVVGGHYDKVEAGMGAIDDWSGASLLPSLYQGLKVHPNHHRYVFIGFTEEETGLHGSQEYVRRMSKPERRQIRAMINLECLGLAPPAVWASRADKRLLNAYFTIVKGIGEQTIATNVDKVGDDDSHPFLAAGIPVLTIHSLTAQNFGLLHSRRDQVAAIDPQQYYVAYRVAAAYLTYLDTVL
jgi:Zn-dependent M28 family amino/carboxypeptidase